jgi:hypothetical protein
MRVFLRFCYHDTSLVENREITLVISARANDEQDKEDEDAQKDHSNAG